MLIITCIQTKREIAKLDRSQIESRLVDPVEG
jgi:hypothetical protein